MKIAELKIKTKINKSKMKKRKLETPGLREEKHTTGNKNCYLVYLTKYL